MPNNLPLSIDDACDYIRRATGGEIVAATIGHIDGETVVEVTFAIEDEIGFATCWRERNGQPYGEWL